jgi:hypothetical protein
MGSMSVCRLALLALVMVACEGKIVPQVVARGSTIMIPIQGSHTEGVNPVPIGYGGESVTDHQRGTLVFKLVGSDCGGSPCRLVTRGTSTVLPSPNTRLMRGETSNPLYFPGGYQHVSIVDVPFDAPVGTWSLAVSRERTRPDGGTDVLAAPAHHGTIEILEEPLGEPTPFEAFIGGGWSSVSGSIGDVVPQPELRLTFNKLVFAIELTIEYPAQTIDVLDVVEPPVPRQLFNANHRAVVLWSDEGEGTLSVRAAGQGGGFKQLSVVFDLDDGENAILDPGLDIQVTNLQAFKADGTPLSASVSSKKIF